MSSLFLCSLKASREALPMNALIVYILVENIKNIGICVASEFELSKCSRNMLFDFGDQMASLSPLPDMTCILSCRIPGPRATKINRLSIYMYNPRVDMRPKPQFWYS